MGFNQRKPPDRTICVAVDLSAACDIVCHNNLRDTNYRNIQYTQNEALRIATGCHKMSSVDHLHVEVKMLKITEHSALLSAHRNTVEPMMLADNRKATVQEIHTDAVNKAVKD